VLGLTAGLRDGFALSILGLVAGIRFESPALLVPGFGAVGFARAAGAIPPA
jgi:hypothetical protein